MTPGGRRPTQSDVARLAGVSQTAVSAVLNADSRLAIAGETRQRILDAVETLGYVPDGAARSLRTGKSFLIASLIPDIANPFYPAFERGIQDLADANGYDLTAYNSDGLREKELRCLRSMMRAKVDGIIATPFQVTPEDFAPFIRDGVPVVVFGEMKEDPTPFGIDEIYVDDVTAASELMAHLLDREYLPLAIIMSPPDILRREGRVVAYRQCLAARGLAWPELMVVGADPTEAAGYAAMQTLLAGRVVPRAVFGTNDMLALGAMVAIREAGLRVPEDIAVAGFDDITVARLLNPPLTTVAQFPENLGRRAAEMLFARLSGDVTGRGRRVEMPHQLKVRESA